MEVARYNSVNLLCLILRIFLIALQIVTSKT